MAKDLNKWIGIGRLGQDVELKYTQSGSAIASLSIACGDDYKDKNTGQKVEQTEWVRVVAFGRLAEIMGEYLTKGSQVYIEGKFRTRKWQDQQGQDRYASEIVANEMQMLGGNQNGGQGSGQGAQQGGGYGQPQNTGHQSTGHQPANQGQPQGAYQRAPQNSQQPPQQGGNQMPPDAFDDDIPF